MKLKDKAVSSPGQDMTGIMPNFIRYFQNFTRVQLPIKSATDHFVAGLMFTLTLVYRDSYKLAVTRENRSLGFMTRST